MLVMTGTWTLTHRQSQVEMTAQGPETYGQKTPIYAIFGFIFQSKYYLNLAQWTRFPYLECWLPIIWSRKNWSQDGRPRRVILYVSFSLLRGLLRQFQSFTRLQLLVFVWFGFKNIPNNGKSGQDEILLDQVYIIDYLKGFIIAVWSKKCAKLSKDSKLTVKRGRAFSSLLK